jgi:hypothetical protein
MFFFRVLQVFHLMENFCRRKPSEFCSDRGRVARYFLLQLTKIGKMYRNCYKIQNGNTNYQNGHKNYQSGHKNYQNGHKIHQNGRKIYQNGRKIYQNGNKIYQNGHEIYQNGNKNYQIAPKFSLLQYTKAGFSGIKIWQPWITVTPKLEMANGPTMAIKVNTLKKGIVRLIFRQLEFVSSGDSPPFSQLPLLRVGSRANPCEPVQRLDAGAQNVEAQNVKKFPEKSSSFHPS